MKCRMAPRTVMIVEDERALQAAASINLRNHGYTAFSVSSQEEALKFLNSEDQIDVIWLDHNLLGEGSGLDLLAQVRKSADWKGIPVFVVTNSGDDAIRDSYKRLGIQKYFVKADSRLEDIVVQINTYFDKKGGVQHAC